MNFDGDLSSDNRARVGKFKFLSQVQQVEPEDPTSGSLQRDSLRRVPFRFVIPHQLISAKSNLPSDYLNLAPSLKSGRALYGAFTANGYMQPNIVYMITANLVSCCGNVPWVVSHDELEIKIMPSIKAAPPLQLAYYPSEFKIECERTLRRHFWGPSIGSIHCFSSEPEPINLAVSTPRAATLVCVKLEWTPRMDLGASASPYEWEITSKYHLKSRTFCSDRPFTKRPTIPSSNTNSNLELRTATLESESRQCKSLGWRLDRLSTRGTIQPEGGTKRWVTFIKIPVNVSKNLSPIFLTPLSTLRYSIHLSIGVAGFSHYSTELEVPVQVIFDDSQIDSLGIGRRGRQSLDDIVDTFASLKVVDTAAVELVEKPPKYSCFE